MGKILNLSKKPQDSGDKPPEDPISGLVEALNAITEEMALQTELLAEMAYKQGAITKEKHTEIFEDE